MLALLVRIPFVLLPPLFSNDVWRHRWDGRVLAAGLDPYRYAPSDPALTRLADPEVLKINHRDIPTVYGPLAQGFLGLLALSPAKASPRSIKAMAAAFDVLAVLSLASLGASLGVGTLAAFAWAVHPLAVIETAGEGHLDGIAVAFLLASLALLLRARGRSASALFAFAVLVKLTPAGAAPAVLRSVGRKGAAITAGLFLLAHLPFPSSGGPWQGLSAYARSWEGNGAVYPELVRLLEATDAAPRAKRVYARVEETLGHPRLLDRGWGCFYAGFFARAILGLTFLLAAVLILKRVADPVRASGLLLAALLALSPTLHPWYLLLVLPFALLFRWTSVAWVSGAAPLYYLTFLPKGTPAFPHPSLVRAIEFLPALALFLLVDRRRPEAPS